MQPALGVSGCQALAPQQWPALSLPTQWQRFKSVAAALLAASLSVFCFEKFCLFGLGQIWTDSKSIDAPVLPNNHLAVVASWCS